MSGEIAEAINEWPPARTLPATEFEFLLDTLDKVDREAVIQACQNKAVPSSHILGVLRAVGGFHNLDYWTVDFGRENINTEIWSD